MKLKELQLIRFGPFTDLLLDLDAGKGDFHLIYGHNEAGKSTTRRAVMGLLFGIPANTTDHHLHKMPDLRIGARIDHSQDGTLHLIRRKGLKETLLDSDEKPVPESTLSHCLDGVGRDMFETSFCLSHESLVEGAQDLLSGKGELGQSLFGAGMGVRRIHALRTELREKAQQIFAPRGQKRPLNKAIKQFKTAKKEVAQKELKPGEWHDLNNRLDEVQIQVAALDDEQSRALAGLNRLLRIRRVLPQVLKREKYLARKKELGPVRVVDPASADKRRSAQQTLESAALQEKKRLDEKKRIEARLNAVDVPDAILAREDEIEKLGDNQAINQKAMKDREELRVRAEAAYRELTVLLRDLRRSEAPDQVQSLRIDTTTKARIQSLMKKFERIDTVLNKAQEDAVAAENRVTRISEGLGALPKSMDRSGLERALAMARPWGDLDEQARVRAEEIRTLEGNASAQTEGLGLFEGSPEAVKRIPVPLDQTVDRFHRQFLDIEKKGAQLKTQAAGAENDFQRVTHELETLESQGAVPSMDDVAEKRHARDRTWQQIRAAWILGEPVFDPTPESAANRYEKQVGEADAVADELVVDADRASRHAALLKEKERHLKEHASLREQLHSVEEENTSLLKQWHAAWQETGIDPLSPEEMRGWLARREKLLLTLEQLRHARSEESRLFEWMARFKEQCGATLEALGELRPAEEESFTPLLQRVEETVAKYEKQELERKQADRDLEEAKNMLHDRQQAFARHVKEMEGWRTGWIDALRGTGLNEDATVDEADTYLTLVEEIFKKADSREQHLKRINDIERDDERFEARVRKLAGESGLDMKGLDIDEAAATLKTRLRKGLDAEQEQKRLEQSLQGVARELNELKRDRESAQAIVDQLMKSAGCDTLEALEEAERRSAELHEVSTRLADIDGQLMAEGVALDLLLEEARAADPDTLPHEIDALERECAKRKEELSEKTKLQGRLQNELDNMDGSSEAAVAAAEVQHALAAMHGNVEQYCRLKLASLVLDRQIERYRQENQDPILELASEMFRAMTVDAFSGLTTGFNDSDEPILLCERAQGERVGVEGLSEGTRDQLYLALRMAGITLHVTRNEPVPVVIDDALINFDDARAEAALRLLGQLSEKTQILFFTHHARLEELAQRAISKEKRVVHTLG